MVVTVLTCAIVVGVVMTVVAYAVLVERRVVARIQARIGPSRVGFGVLATLPVVGRFFGFLKELRFWGLGHPIADGVKLFLKEDIEPRDCDKWMYRLAPITAVLPVLLGFAVIPFGPSFSVLGREIHLQISSIRLDLLYILAVGSLGAYGVILAGWSSNSKYSMLGALRAAAQIISYELPLGIALLSVVAAAGTLSLGGIVAAQSQSGWFLLTQPLAFAIVVICTLAEANRSPFDLPEAESELVAGFFTEYSGMRMALFFLSEYMHLILSGAVVTSVFLGGYLVPFVPAASTPWWLGVISFSAKVGAYLFFCMVTRSTLPRLRYDQLMNFSWKLMVPLATLNLLATALWAAVAR